MFPGSAGHLFDNKKKTPQTNLGLGSFEMSFRGGFNGNNGAFQYPNPENQICSNVDSTVLIFTGTCIGQWSIYDDGMQCSGVQWNGSMECNAVEWNGMDAF